MLYAGEGAHHRAAAAAGSAERRRGAGPVPGKEQREVELGHRVPLPTRGTTFRLRICCRSPADTPLPPLPSCSISPPFTAKTWGRAPDVLLWLALTYGRSPLRTSAVSASPSAWALLISPTALSTDGFFFQSERTADGRGGARVVPAPHVANGSPRHNTLLPPTGKASFAPVGRALLRPSLQRHL